MAYRARRFASLVVSGRVDRVCAGRLAAAAATALALAGPPQPAAAQSNAGCSGGATRTCASGVGDGIAFGAPGVSSVIVSGGPANPSTLADGVVGISLTGAAGSIATPSPATFGTRSVCLSGAGAIVAPQSGACPSGSSEQDILTVDADGTGAGGSTDVVISGQLVKVVDVDDGGGGTVQQLQNASSSAVITNAQLDVFTDTVSPSAGTASGVSVTNTGAVVRTNQAVGVRGTTQGRNGSNGGVINVLFLYERGLPGGAGETGGLASVTNSGEITVTGAGAGAHGISAVSTGGNGGKGGGFGALVAQAGAGGAGGDGGEVRVTLQGGADITTNGVESSGVFALSQGGRGGASGDVGGAFAIGDDGGRGGGARDVRVISQAGVVEIETVRDGSHGIYAASIGGGSGDAGTSGGLAAWGGAGGQATSGGKVTVDLSAQTTIKTGGSNAFGIYAQSIGGGGGDGGRAGALFAAVGGKGGSGGDADTVSVSADGTITTAGDRSSAIYAQSIGGGGGDGGDSLSFGVGVSVSIGGGGGLGGVGKAVTVATGPGALTTSGDDAFGILAQSIGGGGGAGGASIAASVSPGPSLSFSLAGDGGAGNSADTVMVTTQGDITTDGLRASAIVAQSIGGGGGQGGLSVAASAGFGPSAAVGLGGDGGAGSIGGKVTVVTTGGVITTGSATSLNSDNSHGVLAQSIGGGGGSGGLSVAGALSATAGVSVGLGGKGTGGGDGGEVVVDNSARIDTFGTGSYGVFAQSIGGGGGDGGSSISATLSANVGVSAGIGGGGGGGGVGKLVDVDNTGAITTHGAQSYGVLAQSVGGGGGSGGNALSFSGSAGLAAASVSVAVAGDGASGGQGGEVRLDNTGANVTTKAAGSTALLAQSIGGGGGSGGYAVAGALTVSKNAGVSAGVAIGGAGGAGGTSGKVTLNNTGGGAISAAGDNSAGVVAQSIAGGGGQGGAAVAGALSFSGGGAVGVSVGLGGVGGTGGDAGEVIVSNDGLVTTTGADAQGLLAQSVGGKGGAGGMSVAASITGSGGASGAIGVSLGGLGGSGGMGDAVRITNSNTVTTDGARSGGVVGQSLGGGGGTGGLAVAGALNFSKSSGAAVSVGVGGAGGDGGSSGLVTIDNSGDVVTKGADAAGVLAQSTGGQGGVGGLSVSGAINATGGAGGAVNVGVGGAGGDGGVAGAVNAITNVREAVSVTNTGAVTTAGARSGGVVAQAIGGDGGQGGAAIGFSLGVSKAPVGAVSVSVGGPGGVGAEAGAVFVDNQGEIRTSGGANVNADGERVNTDAQAILAQSIGGSGGQGGVGGSAAIALSNRQAVGVSVAVGGVGGAGGRSGAVTVQNSADLSTGSDNSMGVVAQSIGGGGGAGGGSISLALGASSGSNAGAVGVSVGGAAGAGVTAGAVRVTSDGDITTLGDSANAILAQSIGGNGGQGGFSITGSGAITAGQKISGSVGVAVGGRGGDGGRAGTVTVGTLAAPIAGRLDTSGEGATGVIAQSIGGGGGAGGFAGALSAVINASTNASKSTAIGVAVGGFGGTGGQADDVVVNSDATIVTDGALSYGVLAQSVGGKGGAGGGAISGTLNFATSQQGNQSFNASVAVGGFGGDGGQAKNVTVTNSGAILTGAAAATVAFDYGTGTDGLTIVDPVSQQDVTITGEHLVKASGLFAHGVVAQSISGDGGAGGFAGALSFTRGSSDQKVSNYNASVSVGGFGGGGADSVGVVTVTNAANASIETQGERAVGILAQSIGGAGGAGGDAGLGPDFWGEEFILDTAVVGTIRAGGDTSGLDLGGGGSFVGATGANSNSLAVSVGGFGGAGGDARIVTDAKGTADKRDDDVAASVIVTNDGQILTLGAKSHGVLAQAIGGGGGSGGLSTSAATAFQASNSKSFSIGVGGFGLSGGDGGRVDVVNTGRIVTLGDGAAGVYAQSVGGGGGQGGDTKGFTLQRKDTAIESEDKKENRLKSGFQVTAQVGGFAGDGGIGSAVNVSNTGLIETAGTLAYGVFAQSIGGGGGDGGNASVSSGEIGAFLENDKTEKQRFRTGKYKFAVGGWGGSGGFGGDVTVDNEGAIVTRGEQAVAIYAQSVGGGGGVGGKASTGLTGDFNLGGFGGSGNDGGLVVVNNTGLISTEANLAHGVFAQSVGGGGGDGGAALFGDARSFRGDLFKAVRQKGLSAGTKKFFDEKIIAPTFGLSIGGFGGSAGDGGDVVVCNGSRWDGAACVGSPADAASAAINTVGVGAHGVMAQSVGGGGGVGGSTTLTNVGKVGIGGLGGAAGDGGDVFVQNDGSISTEGEGAYGIFAQSVGGGGGAAGDITFGIEGFGEDVAKIERGVADLTGALSQAAPIDVDGDGAIGDRDRVYSDLIYGIAVDPARFATGLPGSLPVPTQLSDLTDAYLDFDGDGVADVALDALQSGGGLGPISLLETFDLDENGLPISDEVSSAFRGLYNAGLNNDPAAAGDSALGMPGFDAFESLTGEASQSAAQDALSDLLGPLLNTPTQSILNGLAKAWGQGDSFDAGAQEKIFGGVFDGQVSGGGVENLTAEDLFDIVRQLNSGSVGPTGLVEVKGLSFDPAVSFNIPLLAGANGDGGDVTVIHNGDIYVQGGASADLEERAGSIGIFAQSVGGGGGIVSETEQLSEAAVGVDANLDGDQTDVFDFSVGRAFAGTIGGQGDGGAVTVIHNGNIIAPAWNGYAVFAQSVGGNDGGKVYVELNGVIAAGLGDDENTSSSILIDGGDETGAEDNEIILGAETFLFGLGDRVVSGTFGDDIVRLLSGGQVIGNINLVTASRGTELATYTDFNSFLVEPGSILRTREIVNLGDVDPAALGDGGVLTVAGSLIVGGEVLDPDLEAWIENNPLGLSPIEAAAALDASSFTVLENQVQTTALTGSLLMTDATPGDLFSPELVVDVRFGVGDSDVITTTDRATVAGVVRPTLLSLSRIQPPVTIVDPEDAAGAANTDGATAIDTAVVDFSVGVDQVDQDGLVASGDSTIDLLIAEIDFSIDGMTRNQQAVGDHINAILTGDGVVTTAENTLTQLFALIANKPLGEEDAVIDLIDRLTTEGYAATQVDTLFAADRFVDAQFDCERRTEVRFDLETGECLWMQFEGAFFDRDDSFQFKPIDSRSFRYAGGVQFRLDETWRLGVSGAYEVVTLEMGERFRGLGDRGHFGVTARYQKSGFDLGFGVSGGYGVFDSRRRIGIDETVASQDSARLTIEQADVDQAITTGMARLSAKWRGETADGRFYLEPQIDLDATYVHSHDATEQNAGQVGVALDGGGQFIFAGSPAIEAGAKFVVHDAAVFRPFVRAGFTAFSDDEMHVDAFLIGAPASAGSFRNRSGFDQLVGEGAVGFVLEDPQLGLHFALGYDVLLGRDTQQHGVRATLGVRF